MKYSISSVSRLVGFYRRHHPIPEMEEIEQAWNEALRGEQEGAIRLLDWRRHCFRARNEREQEAMSRIMRYASELFTTD